MISIATNHLQLHFSKAGLIHSRIGRFVIICVISYYVLFRLVTLSKHVVEYQTASMIHDECFRLDSPRIGIPPLQLADLPTVYTTTNQKSALDPAFYAKRGTQETH